MPWAMTPCINRVIAACSDRSHYIYKIFPKAKKFINFTCSVPIGLFFYRERASYAAKDETKEEGRKRGERDTTSMGTDSEHPVYAWCHSPRQTRTRRRGLLIKHQATQAGRSDVIMAPPLLPELVNRPISSDFQGRRLKSMKASF